MWLRLLMEVGTPWFPLLIHTWASLSSSLVAPSPSSICSKKDRKLCPAASCPPTPRHVGERLGPQSPPCLSMHCHWSHREEHHGSCYYPVSTTHAAVRTGCEHHRRVLRFPLLPLLRQSLGLHYCLVRGRLPVPGAIAGRANINSTWGNLCYLLRFPFPLSGQPNSEKLTSTTVCTIPAWAAGMCTLAWPAETVCVSISMMVSTGLEVTSDRQISRREMSSLASGKKANIAQ